MLMSEGNRLRENETDSLACSRVRPALEVLELWRISLRKQEGSKIRNSLGSSKKEMKRIGHIV